MSAPRCTPGTIYYVLRGREWSQSVYVGRCRIATSGTAEEEACILAIPADSTGPREIEVRLLGGTAEAMEDDKGIGWATLIATSSLQGCRTRKPARPVIQWPEETAPRLDTLVRLAETEKTLRLMRGSDMSTLTVVSGAEDTASEADGELATRNWTMRSGRTYPEMETPAQAPVIRRVTDRRRVNEQRLEPVPEREPEILEMLRRLAMKQVDAPSRKPNAFGQFRTDVATEDLLRRVKETLGRTPAGAQSVADGAPVSRGVERFSEGGEEDDGRERRRRPRRTAWDESSSSDDGEDGGTCKRGRRASKLRHYEKLKGSFRRRLQERWSYLEALAKHVLSKLALQSAGPPGSRLLASW